MLHQIFRSMTEQKILYYYVFTSKGDTIRKNFGLALSNGEEMTTSQIALAGSFLQRIYTGTYDNMEDLFADSNDEFIEKLVLQ